VGNEIIQAPREWVEGIEDRKFDRRLCCEVRGKKWRVRWDIDQNKSLVSSVSLNLADAAEDPIVMPNDNGDERTETDEDQDEDQGDGSEGSSDQEAEESKELIPHGQRWTRVEEDICDDLPRSDQQTRIMFRDGADASARTYLDCFLLMFPMPAVPSILEATSASLGGHPSCCIV
jgi:hypothetical protein